jgi:hypothetical protein
MGKMASGVRLLIWLNASQHGRHHAAQDRGQVAVHVYLDSRDLIGLIERRSSKEVARFDEKLQRGGSELIFSMHNILELCAPLVSAGPGSSVMRTLNELERMPHLYVAEARIDALELKEATDAFLERREYRPIALPVVPRFDYVVSAFEREPVTKAFLKYGLAQIIFELWRIDKSLFTGYSLHAKCLRVAFEVDRKKDDYRRHELNFGNKIARELRLYGIGFPDQKTDELSKWIYENSTRCPALRLGYEVFHKILRNLTDIAKDSDIPDFAHISCVPYVDAITLDKRMRGYVAQVDQSIGTNHSQHIYRNLREIEPLL